MNTEPEVQRPWSMESSWRHLFNVLLAIAVILGGLTLVYITVLAYQAHATKAHTTKVASEPEPKLPGLSEPATTPRPNTGVAPGAQPTKEEPSVELEPIPGTPVPPVGELPDWVKVFLCFEVFFFALLLATIAYLVAQWLEEQERVCSRGRRRRWWQRLLCFLAPILKWVLYWIAVATVIAAFILLILCLIFFV